MSILELIDKNIGGLALTLIIVVYIICGALEKK